MWTAVGRAEIIDRVNELLEATDALDVAYDPPVKFAVVGDYAFKHYTSVTTVTLPNGASQQMATRTTTIAHRGNDGNWRYIVDHNSSP
jgi:ketosteroid isomerase-like protein